MEAICQHVPSLYGLAEGEINTIRTGCGVDARLEWKHSVITKARRAAPNHHVSVRQRHALYFIAPMVTAELKDRWKSE